MSKEEKLQIVLNTRRVSGKISIKKASELLGVARSSVYYKREGEREENIKLMNHIERIYSKDSTLGYRRIKAILEKDTGEAINKKRVRRLMRLLGLKGIYPKKVTTQSVLDRKTRDMVKGKAVKRPNQVWTADITYIKVNDGYAYGIFIMGWYSRKILSYELSNTMDEWMCVEALESAIKKHGMPEIMHTDRGRQFMGRRYRKILEESGVKISVGERGYKDNILIERLFRSYKWECVYLRDRMDLKELKEITKEWVDYYNRERPHQSLGYKAPDDVYYGEVVKEAS